MASLGLLVLEFNNNNNGIIMSWAISYQQYKMTMLLHTLALEHSLILVSVIAYCSWCSTHSCPHPSLYSSIGPKTIGAETQPTRFAVFT